MDYPYFLIQSNSEFWNGKCFADRSQAKPYATERGAIGVARKARSRGDRAISISKVESEGKVTEIRCAVVNLIGGEQIIVMPWIDSPFLKKAFEDGFTR